MGACQRVKATRLQDSAAGAEVTLVTDGDAVYLNCRQRLPDAAVERSATLQASREAADGQTRVLSHSHAALQGWAFQRRSPAALQELDWRELLEHIEVSMRSPPRHSC